jgi:hypothetical protein
MWVMQSNGENMVQESKVIKNPLTVVGIFAGLVEICGSLVLPNISALQQGIFVWFLMGFPTLLLVLFFITLNFNHRVLYAPSDYKDEDNFVKSIFPSKPIEEREKLQDELAELAKTEPAVVAQVNLNTLHSPGTSTAHRILSKILSQRKERFLAAESLAVRKLELEYGDQFQRGVTFGGLGNSKVSFDGLMQTKNTINVFEIKYVDSIQGLDSRIEKVLASAKEASRAIPTNSKASFSLTLILVLDNGIQTTQVESALAAILQQSSIRVELRAFTYHELIERAA